ncbi:subtilisin inhibitor CLSI-I-like [Mercurialis annua]|uniref:subtilisin inhibitor CLSI-I-like n=1 Tax=Mercurialis annua TaxID=3986 RepID=UPI0021607E14|nr:subtilisin inhibitor CLSI-I-like [Mercurialis annua]XP_050229170.1 subtilisin inhibitor CLSI-I-like [Mercurialis annua]
MAEKEEIVKSSQEEETAQSTPPLLPRTCGNLLGPISTGRRTWPDLVGVTAEEAERKIKEDMAGAEVQVVPPDCFITMDFKVGRVRLFIDSSGKVAKPPIIG